MNASSSGTPPESQLNDLSLEREDELVRLSCQRGYATFEEIEALYPRSNGSHYQADALLMRLLDLGVNTVSAASIRPLLSLSTRTSGPKTGPSREDEVPPLDTLQLYLAEIRQIPILAQNQERWLFVARSAVAPFGAENEPGVAASQYEKYIRVPALEQRRVLQAIAHSGKANLVSDVSPLFPSLVRDIACTKGSGVPMKTVALASLLAITPDHAHDDVFKLCEHLFVLPSEFLESVALYAEATGSRPWSVSEAPPVPSQPMAEALADLTAFGRKITNDLVKHNLRLVAHFVRPYQDNGLPLLDLIQEGNLGLMRAVERFDYRRGWRFATYASWWIRQSAMRAIADTSRVIRVPVHMHEAYLRIERARALLEKELGRQPRLSEIAERCGMATNVVRRVLARIPKILSLDALLCCSEFPLRWLGPHCGFLQEQPCPIRVQALAQVPVNDNLPDTYLEDHPCALCSKLTSSQTSAHDVDYSMLSYGSAVGTSIELDDIVTRNACTAILTVLQELAPREQKVIQTRFGLLDGHESTLEEVGESMGITRERVRQIQVQALKKLQYAPRQARLQRALCFGTDGMIIR